MFIQFFDELALPQLLKHSAGIVQADMLAVHIRRWHGL